MYFIGQMLWTILHLMLLIPPVGLKLWLHDREPFYGSPSGTRASSPSESDSDNGINTKNQLYYCTYHFFYQSYNIILLKHIKAPFCIYILSCKKFQLFILTFLATMVSVFGNLMLFFCNATDKIQFNSSSSQRQQSGKYFTIIPPFILLFPVVGHTLFCLFLCL